MGIMLFLVSQKNLLTFMTRQAAFTDKG
jgi:hypothetical protein